MAIPIIRTIFGPFIVKSGYNMTCSQRYLKEEASCEEYGCSYTKDGSPDEVYCFKDGSYQAEAGNECPSEATGNYQALAKVYILVHLVSTLMLSQSA